MDIGDVVVNRRITPNARKANGMHNLNRLLLTKLRLARYLLTMMMFKLYW